MWFVNSSNRPHHRPGFLRRFARLRAPNAILLTAALLPLAAGCRSVGPGTVKRDRLHYATAVADSWKEQLLLNIVKTRYADAPAFLEVVSVVSGYSLETGVSLGGQISPGSLGGGDTFAAGGLGSKFTDRPTISYSPMTGDKFAHSLLAPAPLEALLFVTQGGAPANFMMGLMVQWFEGHQNSGTFAGQFHAADLQFSKLLQVVRDLQGAKAVEFEVANRQDDVELWIRFHSIDPAILGPAEKLAELKALLRVPAHLDRVKVVFGTQEPEPDVVGIRTRSLMQILSALGAGVEIHPDHLADGSAFPLDPSLAPAGFKVRSGTEEPDEAFVAVPYQGLWFWIDRRDLASKTTLAAVTLLFHFLEGGTQASPVLTIPTN